MSSLLGKARPKRQSMGRRIEGLNWLPILAITAVILSLGNTLGMVFMGTAYFGIANKKQPTLVQTVDGQAINTVEDDYLNRSIPTIRGFVRSELLLLLTWTGYTLDEEGIVVKDKGLDYDGNKISSRAHEAQYGLSTEDGFRQDIMRMLASWHTPDYLQGNKTQTLEIGHIHRPKEIEPGKWSVGVVATRTISTGRDGHEEYTTFNRTLYVRAVDPHTDPLKETATVEQKAFYKVRQAGLEIYAMRGFNGEEM